MKAPFPAVVAECDELHRGSNGRSWRGGMSRYESAHAAATNDAGTTPLSPGCPFTVTRGITAGMNAGVAGRTGNAVVIVVVNIVCVEGSVVRNVTIV